MYVCIPVCVCGSICACPPGGRPCPALPCPCRCSPLPAPRRPCRAVPCWRCDARGSGFTISNAASPPRPPLAYVRGPAGYIYGLGAAPPPPRRLALSGSARPGPAALPHMPGSRRPFLRRPATLWPRCPMAPLADVGPFLGGLDGLGQPVGAHFLLPPAGERPALLGERRAAERAGGGGAAAAAAAAAADLAHLQGILRRRQLYCRTGFHLQILPDGSVRGTRQDHSLFGRSRGEAAGVGAGV